jgi:hypothetical protein
MTGRIKINRVADLKRRLPFMDLSSYQFATQRIYSSAIHLQSGICYPPKFTSLQ